MATTTPSSQLFLKPNITRFRAAVSTELAAKNLTLLNLEEFYQYMYITRLEATGREFRPLARRAQQAAMERATTVEAVINELALKVCTKIGISYGQRAVSATIRPKHPPGFAPRYDILVLATADYAKFVTTTKTSLTEQRFAKIRGFIVAELGECRAMPNTYTVNLICSKVAGGGSFLMGAYLYCIKLLPRLDQRGLLELAGGFTNTGGLCAYSKFGYLPRLECLGPQCFGDIGNLPMDLDLYSIKTEDIVAVVRGTGKIEPQYDVAEMEQNLEDVLVSHPLCERDMFDDPKEQEKLAELYNRLYRNVYQMQKLVAFDADKGVDSAVDKLVRQEFDAKVKQLETKKGDRLEDNEYDQLYLQTVTQRMTEKQEVLMRLSKTIQAKKRELLERKRKWLLEKHRAASPGKKGAVWGQLENINAMLGAMNPVMDFAEATMLTPSPESVVSAATTVTEISKSTKKKPKSPPRHLVPITPEEHRANELAESRHLREQMAAAKKSRAKQAARKTATELAKQKSRGTKRARSNSPRKTARKRKTPPRQKFAAETGSDSDSASASVSSHKSIGM